MDKFELLAQLLGIQFGKVDFNLLSDWFVQLGEQVWIWKDRKLDLDFFIWTFTAGFKHHVKESNLKGIQLGGRVVFGQVAEERKLLWVFLAHKLYKVKNVLSVVVVYFEFLPFLGNLIS